MISHEICFLHAVIGSNTSDFAFQPPCLQDAKLQLFNETTYSINMCNMECSFLMGVTKKCNCVPFIESKAYPLCEFEKLVSCWLI